MSIRIFIAGFLECVFGNIVFFHIWYFISCSEGISTPLVAPQLKSCLMPFFTVAHLRAQPIDPQLLYDRNEVANCASFEQFPLLVIELLIHERVCYRILLARYVRKCGSLKILPEIPYV